MNKYQLENSFPTFKAWFGMIDQFKKLKLVLKGCSVCTTYANLDSIYKKVNPAYNTF